MLLERLFASNMELDLLTPPETPFDSDEDFSFDDISPSIEFTNSEQELFTQNFSWLQDLLSEANDDSSIFLTKTRDVVREDFMWGNEINRSETSTPSLLQSIRERSFTITSNLEDSIMSKCDETNSSETDNHSMTNDDLLGTGCLLTPAETESDCEIDVVGDTGFYCKLEPETSVKRLPTPVPETRRKNDLMLSSSPLEETSQHLANRQNVNTPCDNAPVKIVLVRNTSRLSTGTLDEEYQLKGKKGSRPKRRKKKFVYSTPYHQENGSSDELSSDSNSPDPNCQRKGSHNSLERKRRVELRRLFEELKTSIPKISDTDRTPKVEILRNAASYVKCLHRQEKQLLIEKEEICAMNICLSQKLNALRNDY